MFLNRKSNIVILQSEILLFLIRNQVYDTQAEACGYHLATPKVGRQKFIITHHP